MKLTNSETIIIQLNTAEYSTQELNYTEVVNSKVYQSLIRFSWTGEVKQMAHGSIAQMVLRKG